MHKICRLLRTVKCNSLLVRVHPTYLLVRLAVFLCCWVTGEKNWDCDLRCYCMYMFKHVLWWKPGFYHSFDPFLSTGLLSQFVSRFSPNLLCMWSSPIQISFVSVKCGWEKSKFNLNLIWDEAPVQRAYTIIPEIFLSFPHFFIFVVIYCLRFQGSVIFAVAEIRSKIFF